MYRYARSHCCHSVKNQDCLDKSILYSTTPQALSALLCLGGDFVFGSTHGPRWKSMRLIIYGFRTILGQLWFIYYMGTALEPNCKFEMLENPYEVIPAGIYFGQDENKTRILFRRLNVSHPSRKSVSNCVGSSNLTSVLSFVPKNWVEPEICQFIYSYYERYKFSSVVWLQCRCSLESDFIWSFLREKIDSINLVPITQGGRKEQT